LAVVAKVCALRCECPLNKSWKYHLAATRCR
jgi:hypothetical protein